MLHLRMFTGDSEMDDGFSTMLRVGNDLLLKSDNIISMLKNYQIITIKPPPTCESCWGLSSHLCCFFFFAKNIDSMLSWEGWSSSILSSSYKTLLNLNGAPLHVSANNYHQSSPLHINIILITITIITIIITSIFKLNKDEIVPISVVCVWASVTNGSC